MRIFFKDYPKESNTIPTHISLAQFKDAFKIKEIKIDEIVLNYMIIQLFNFSDSLKKLEKSKLFEIFPIQKPSQEKNSLSDSD